jgi:hypothetical protein
LVVLGGWPSIRAKATFLEMYWMTLTSLEVRPAFDDHLRMKSGAPLSRNSSQVVRVIVVVGGALLALILLNIVFRVVTGNWCP